MKKTGGRMWHEARKQEKKIRGMLVDYRRRAERRRDYYEKIVWILFSLTTDHTIYLIFRELILTSNIIIIIIVFFFSLWIQ